MGRARRSEEQSAQTRDISGICRPCTIREFRKRAGGIDRMTDMTETRDDTMPDRLIASQVLDDGRNGCRDDRFRRGGARSALVTQTTRETFVDRQRAGSMVSSHALRPPVFRGRQHVRRERRTVDENEAKSRSKRQESAPPVEGEMTHFRVNPIEPTWAVGLPRGLVHCFYRNSRPPS